MKLSQLHKTLLTAVLAVLSFSFVAKKESHASSKVEFIDIEQIELIAGPSRDISSTCVSDLEIVFEKV